MPNAIPQSTMGHDAPPSQSLLVYIVGGEHGASSLHFMRSQHMLLGRTTLLCSAAALSC